MSIQSRRTFLQTLSLGTSAFFVSDKSLDFLHEGKKLGVALVGLGNYSTRQLAPALLQTNFCELKGIVTGSPEKAEKWAKQYNIAKQNIYNYTNFDDIKNNKDIDIVYVVLPNSMHAEFTIRAAKAGKHVICEKPMAMNVQECHDIINACGAAKVHLAIDYRLYFEPHHLEMRRLGTEKVKGALKIVESGLGYSMADPKSWRLNKGLGGGGAIMDLGVYCVQGVRRTLGELPTSVMGQGFIRDEKIFKGIYEMMLFSMEFPSGAVSNSTTTYTSFMDRLHATTGSGWFSLQPSFTAGGAKGNTSDGAMTFKTAEFQQIKQMDDFAECIINNRKSAASGEEGLVDMKIIEAIKQSADTGRKINLTW
jgi:predicted dehydrogenase